MLGRDRGREDHGASVLGVAEEKLVTQSTRTLQFLQRDSQLRLVVLFLFFLLFRRRRRFIRRHLRFGDFFLFGVGRFLDLIQIIHYRLVAGDVLVSLQRGGQLIHLRNSSQLRRMIVLIGVFVLREGTLQPGVLDIVLSGYDFPFPLGQDFWFHGRLEC